MCPTLRPRAVTSARHAPIALVLALGLSGCASEDASPDASSSDPSPDGSSTSDACPDCGAACGDAMCNDGETCSDCDGDGGSVSPSCGDGVCDGSETCSSCEADCGGCLPAADHELHIAPDGSDGSGDGSKEQPWATLTHALDQVPSSGNAFIWMHDGVYEGQLEVEHTFDEPVWVRALHPYRARLTATDNPVLDLGGTNVGFEGLEIVGQEGTTDSTGLVYLWSAEACSFRNNIIHDSYYNDLMRVLHSDDITIAGNIFYNQAASDEHIDVNGGSRGTVIEDNVFFNDYAGSGRDKEDGHSFIVIKSSNRDNGITGDAVLRRNIFMHYEGNKGMLRLGSDGESYHEAEDLLLENNLFVYNGDPIDGALLVLDAADITVRANSFVGTQLDDRFVGYVGTGEGSPPSERVYFYNNVFSRPDGNMRRLFASPSDEVEMGELNNNLYYNGGEAIPTGSDDAFDHTLDEAAVIADPHLPAGEEVTLPRWTGSEIAGGHASIVAAFEALVEELAVHGSGSAARDAADPSNMPSEDVLGRARHDRPDIGAVETPP